MQPAVITYLEISQLGELLAALVEPAGEGLDLLVHDLVRSYVAALGEFLAANVAGIWPFAGVTSLVCLMVHVSECVRVKEMFTYAICTFKFPSWENLCPHEGSLHSCLLVSGWQAI